MALLCAFLSVGGPNPGPITITLWSSSPPKATSSSQKKQETLPPLTAETEGWDRGKGIGVGPQCHALLIWQRALNFSLWKLLCLFHDWLPPFVLGSQEQPWRTCQVADLLCGFLCLTNASTQTHLTENQLYLLVKRIKTHTSLNFCRFPDIISFSPLVTLQLKASLTFHKFCSYKILRIKKLPHLTRWKALCCLSVKLDSAIKNSPFRKTDTVHTNRMSLNKPSLSVRSSPPVLRLCSAGRCRLCGGSPTTADRTIHWCLPPQSTECAGLQD